MSIAAFFHAWESAFSAQLERATNVLPTPGAKNTGDAKKTHSRYAVPVSRETAGQWNHGRVEPVSVARRRMVLRSVPANHYLLDSRFT